MVTCLAALAMRAARAGHAGAMLAKELQEAVGASLEVQQADNSYRQGKVVDFDAQTTCHTIRYEDGHQKSIRLWDAEVGSA